MPILIRDLHEHGYSDDIVPGGCQKCRYDRSGQLLRAKNHNHSEACRASMYECLRKANDPRIVAADAQGAERTRVQPSDSDVREHKHEPNTDTPATPSRLDAAPETPRDSEYWQHVLDEPLSAEAGIGLEDTVDIRW